MKSTKKALILSVISLLACVSMLVGSTFAWFTDSVTSAGNKIQAGTLKIDLELLDKQSGEWSSIKESKAALFNYDLWEPGYTEVKVLKIENEGTLALKWVAQFQSNVELSALANVIDVYVLASETEIGYPADRNLSGYEKVGTVAEFVNTIEETTHGTLLAKDSNGDEAYLAIALKMQESAGNEYQGLSLGEFDIRIFATQYTYEEDSFDKYYDEMAVVSNAADLQAAIAAGKDVILNGDIAVTAPIAVAKDVEASIDLNGHTISALTNKDSGNQYAIQVKGDLTIQGEGSIVVKHVGANMGWGALVAGVSVEGGSLTLGEGVSIINQGGSDMAYAVDVNTTLGESVLNVNGATLYSSYIGVRIFNNHATAKGIVNYNSGTIYGAKNGYDVWAQLMSAPAENAIVNIADGIEYTTTATSGTMYYFADEVAYVANADGLKNALTNGGNIVLMADIALSQDIAISNANFVLDGNGYTISGSTNIAALDITGGTATVKNVTFDGIQGGSAIRTVGVMFNASNVTVKNCVQKKELQGLFRLLGENTIENCSFINNTCNMAVSLNYDTNDNVDPQVVNGCVFENNTCSVTAVLYYAHGTSFTVNGNKFLNNTVNTTGNAATVYVGFMENATITNNLFKGNDVTGTTKRVAGGLMIGYEAEVSGNAFIDNTVTGSIEGLGNDVCASVYYTDIDLSGNYWGGNAPVADDDYFVEYPDRHTVIINDYLTENPFN